LFLAPELIHFYGDTDLFRWATKIGDFFKVVSHFHEYCSSAAFGDVLGVGKVVLLFMCTPANGRLHLAHHLLAFSEAVPSVQRRFR
jgi:hypothetical protein